jgi:ribosomal protein S18 acetylase RimI-like enzyme
MKLRQATTTDYGFVYLVKIRAFKEYIEQTWGWNENWQKDYHKKNFNPAVTQIITLNKQDVGLLIVTREKNEIRVNEIYLLPEFQKQGIGTNILKEIIREAKTSKKRIWLQVLKVNPAINLYRRLGFRVIGETDVHLQMEIAEPVVPSDSPPGCE